MKNTLKCTADIIEFCLSGKIGNPNFHSRNKQTRHSLLKIIRTTGELDNWIRQIVSELPPVGEKQNFYRLGNFGHLTYTSWNFVMTIKFVQKMFSFLLLAYFVKSESFSLGSRDIHFHHTFSKYFITFIVGHEKIGKWEWWWWWYDWWLWQ